MTFAEVQSEVQRVGGLDSSIAADTTSGAAWTAMGLRAIVRAAPWSWLRRTIEITLVGDTYEYAFSDFASDLFRLDAKSIRYGGKDDYLEWGAIESVDDVLGPDWKDSGTDAGTPEYVTRFGNNIWVAKKPSDDFVASYPILYGYGWRNEPSSGELYLPDPYFEVAVEASLAYGWYEEDDPRAQEKLAHLHRVLLPEMMGAQLDINAGDRLQEPAWMSHSRDNFEDYGDA